jgi:hypothetical protein
MKKIVALMIAASLTSVAYAAPENFVIEPSHSMPRFEYSHFGYSVQLSRFDSISGNITLDRAAKTGSVNVTIDAKSVNTGSALFNGHIHHLQIKQAEVRRRQVSRGGRLPDDQGHHQAGHAHRQFLPVHAASDAEERCLRRHRYRQGQTF